MLCADNELNVSSFTVRCIASTAAWEICKELSARKEGAP
jgi:hypothetical protein